MIDFDKVRADTPACEAGTYLNTASVGLLALSTGAILRQQLDRETNVGPAAAKAAVLGGIEKIYSAAARLLRCAPDEIAFVESHSRGWQAAVAALLQRTPLKPGDRLLVGRSEWGGNYAALSQRARLAGATVGVVPCDETGQISAEALARMVDEKVRLISLTWVAANGGLIQPAAAVGAVARAAGVPFVLDASQAVGQLEVDVGALGCDVLTTPGRKWLRGGRGTGLLFVRRGLLDGLEPNVLDHMSAPLDGDIYKVRADARRFEASDSSVAARLGLGAALDAALAIGLPAIRARIDGLAHDLREQLSDVPGLRVCDGGWRDGAAQSGLVSFTVEGQDPHKVQRALTARGIELAVNGQAYTPLDMKARGLSDILRASVHYYTAPQDTARLVQALATLSMG